MKKLGKVIPAVIIALFLGSHSFAGINVGLIAHYPFNGNANDVSGNGQDATVYGATLSTDRFNNSDHAYYFDGNDHIRIQSHSLFNSQNLTLSAWVYYDQPFGSEQRRIVNRQENRNKSWGMEILGPGYPGSSATQLTGHAGWGGGWIKYVGTTNLQIDTWYHVVTSHDSNTNKIKVYVNGVLESSCESQGLISAISSDIIIGRLAKENRMYWHGGIDDIRIYNRALSANEISELYNQPVANAGPYQVVCNEICSGAVLDGRKSYDPNGEIVSYFWQIQHRENSSYDRNASGETPTLFDLAPGVYDVTLTITDDNNLTDTGETILSVVDTCNPCSIMKGDLDGDGDVDGNDLSIFSQHYGTIPLAP